MRHRIGRALACLLIGAGSLSAAADAAASGGLGFESAGSLALDAHASPDAQAGSHPYALTTSVKLRTTTDAEGHLLSQGGDIKDLLMALPPGLVLNAQALPACGAAEFATLDKATEEDGCPDAAAVGVAAIENVAPATLAERRVTDYAIYNLTPPSGTPAQFGIDVAGAAIYLTMSVRSGGDYGLTVAMTGIPQNVHLLGGAVTFWGVPADAGHDGERGDCVQSHATCPAGATARPFLTLPTQCLAPPAATLSADSWQQAGAFTATATTSVDGAATPLTGCAELAFAPTLHTQLESATAASESGVAIDLHMPQSEDPAGLAQANLQSAQFALPAGATLNLARANGLLGCAPEGAEGVNLSSGEPAHCPEASRVGAVKIKTPFLSGELLGGVYLAQQGNLAGAGANPFGSLLALYAVAEGAGVTLKLPVEVAADPQTGQLSLHVGPDATTARTPAPLLPLEDIQLEFEGGPHAVLATPPACGDYTTSATLAPWSGTPPVALTDESHITEGCPSGFAPAFGAGPADTQAEAFTPINLTLARHDGEQELKGLSVTLPTGMLAIVGNVEECPEPQAAQGTCGPGSLIGEATASVGVGAEGLALPGGKVYFTGPHGGGPFGLSLVMPAVAGPLNLGPEGRPLVVRVGISVNPITGRVTAATDAGGPFAIPTLLQGIAPQIKALSITLNRPEFTFNPSGCQPLAITGTAVGTQGATASLSAPVQMTNCGALPFGPKLTAATIGKPSRENGIGLDVKIVEGYAHESNAHYVKVELPKQLPSRLSTLRRACPQATFEANPATCPVGSVIGTATTVTSVLPVPLVGPAYLVSYGNAQFPELVMVLQADGVTIEAHGQTFIDKSGITSTTFPDVPDAPIPSFELRLPAGPYSVLSAQGDLCSKPQRMTTTIVAYNGLTVKESPPIAIAGCRPKLKVLRHTFHGHTIKLAVRVPAAGTLTARGAGFARRTVKVARTGTVVLELKLSKHARRALARKRKHRRKFALVVKLAFAPRRGHALSARVTVRAR